MASTPESLRIQKFFEGNCSLKNICPVKDIIAHFSNKWTIYAILLLGQHERMRFSELRSSVQGISQRMLAVTLRLLEEDGIVYRTVYSETPPRVEYELTRLGNSLLIQLLGLANWADTHFEEILKARKKYEKKKAN